MLSAADSGAYLTLAVDAHFSASIEGDAGIMEALMQEITIQCGNLQFNIFMNEHTNYYLEMGISYYYIGSPHDTYKIGT